MHSVSRVDGARPFDRPIAPLLGVAAAVGAAYAFSPLSVLFAIGMTVLAWWGSRGLSGMERRWFLGSFTLALLLRVVVLIAFYLMTDPLREQFHALYGDGHFSIQRSLWILNDWRGLEIGPYYRMGIYAPYGGSGYDRCLAILQWFLGPSPHALTLVSVAAFLGGAVVLYRVVRPAFGVPAAVAGLVVLLFWPTFFAWSVAMLKETIQFLLSALAVAAAVQIARGDGWWRRTALFAVVAALVMLVAPIRAGSDLMLLVAIVFGYAVMVGARRSLALLTLVVLLIGGSAAAFTRPAVQARVQAQVRLSIGYHLGHVFTPGKSYRAADQDIYSGWPENKYDPISFDQGARFLLRSAVMFVLAPLPAEVVSVSELAFLPQQLAWFSLIGLAVVGAWVGVRRDALLAGTCVGYCVAAMAILAPNSGNIGTLIRHRDAIVPFLAWLGGLGAATLLSTVTQTHHASD